MLRLSLPVVAFALFAGSLAAQEPIRLSPSGGEKSFADVGSVDVKVVPAQAKPGQLVMVRLTVTPKNGAWTYPANPPEGQFALNEISPPRNGTDPLIFVGPITDPPGSEKKAGAIPGTSDVVYKRAATWELQAIVSPKATPGTKSMPLNGVSVQVCKTKCFNSDRKNPPTADFEVLAGPAEPVKAEFAAEVDRALAPKALPAGPATPAQKNGSGKPTLATEEYQAQLDKLAAKIEAADSATDKTKSRGNLWGLLLTAAFWGLVSLITPCVFPMIPITVSLFFKQAQQSTKQVVKLSAVYCLTIVTVLGLSAFFFLTLFREASVDPYMNILLGLAFVAFAASLFGAFDMTFQATLVVFMPVVVYAVGWSLIKSAVKSGSLPEAALLPSGTALIVLVAAFYAAMLFGGNRFNLVGFLDRQRGIGGMIGTMFGAVAFSIVSFTCVAPFLGGFSAYVSSGQYQTWELILAALAFSGAFAFPFFFLALFPRLLKSLPKSGGWLDAVKVVMGFLELAAVLKFFRTAELRLLPRPEYFTYDIVLGGWVAISLVTALYLFRVFRMTHDENDPRVGVVRLLAALGFVGFGIYLAPALLKNGDERNRPDGVIYAWVDAFLLPDPSAPAGTDLPGTVDRVVQEKRDGKAVEKPYIFVDFTGVTCTNCKYNEENVFTKSDVKDLLDKYELVQLYTDDVPAAAYQVPPDQEARKAEASANLGFQKKLFGTEQLPLYAILAPQASGKVKVVAVYDEGKINDVAAFTAFLKQPLAK